MRRAILACFLLILAATCTFAAQLIIPVTTVNGTDVFSGPTFTVGTNLLPTDTLSLTASGIVTLQGPSAFGTNAAGVVVLAGSTGVGGSLANGSTTFGSLLIGTGGVFHQIFATNAANGLGSSSPPTTLTITNVPLSSIFGSGLSAGTVVELRISDINTGDNFGRFTLSQAQGVPEPATFVLLGSSFLGLAFLIRRRH